MKNEYKMNNVASSDKNNLTENLLLRQSDASISLGDMLEDYDCDDANRLSDFSFDSRMEQN